MFIVNCDSDFCLCSMTTLVFSRSTMFVWALSIRHTSLIQWLAVGGWRVARGVGVVVGVSGRSDQSKS